MLHGPSSYPHLSLGYQLLLETSESRLFLGRLVALNQLAIARAPAECQTQGIGQEALAGDLSCPGGADQAAKDTDLGSLSSFSLPARTERVGASGLGLQTILPGLRPPQPFCLNLLVFYFLETHRFPGSTCAVSPSLQNPPRPGLLTCCPCPLTPASSWFLYIGHQPGPCFSGGFPWALSCLL